jgi:hypothetical protein
LDGKDAFHRVPDFARNEWNVVERVLARFRSAMCVTGTKSSLLHEMEERAGERRRV